MVEVPGSEATGRSPASTSKRTMPAELQHTTLKYKKYSTQGNPEELTKASRRGVPVVGIGGGDHGWHTWALRESILSEHASDIAESAEPAHPRLDAAHWQHHWVATQAKDNRAAQHRRFYQSSKALNTVANACCSQKGTCGAVPHFLLWHVPRR